MEPKKEFPKKRRRIRRKNSVSSRSKSDKPTNVEQVKTKTHEQETLPEIPNTANLQIKNQEKSDIRFEENSTTDVDNNSNSNVTVVGTEESADNKNTRKGWWQKLVE